jgi:hypothetical protein
VLYNRHHRDVRERGETILQTRRTAAPVPARQVLNRRSRVKRVVVFDDVRVAFDDVYVVFDDVRVVFDEYQILISHTPFPMSHL